MSDKRIIKTKKNIKSTFIKLLQKESFESITVTKLCELGETSRITFYTYYGDKYDLVEEMFLDYIKEADEDYHRMMETVSQEDKLAGYHNLLECILNLYYNNIEFFSHATPSENPYLHSAFYQHIFKNVEVYITRHRDIKPKYTPRQTAALICNGVWSVITESNSMKLSNERVRSDAKGVYNDLISSALFLKH